MSSLNLSTMNYMLGFRFVRLCIICFKHYRRSEERLFAIQKGSKRGQHSDVLGGIDQHKSSILIGFSRTLLARGSKY